MRSVLLIGFLLCAFVVSAQKKPIVKPIKLLTKSKNHTVSMEFTDDVLYFTRLNLISLLELNTNSQSSLAIRYLRGTGNDEIKFKQNDTLNFKNAGERNLYKVVLQLAPKLTATGYASDMVKKTHTFNAQVIVKPCEADEAKKVISDKKGRIIFNCE